MVTLLALALMSFDRVPVAVKVVDAAGNPVANIKVAAQWVPKMPEMALPLIPMEALTTGADGIAKGTADGSYPVVLSAFDQDKHLGGFVSIGRETKDAVIRLLPMQKVLFTYATTGAALKNPWLQIQLVVPTGGVTSLAREAYVLPFPKGEAYLPVGNYRFLPGAENANGREAWFEIPKTAGVFSAPKFEFTATKVATLSGRAAPEIDVVGAMNASGKVKLVDYKGKWVLIDFWGTWCSACRSEMPSLIEFYNQNKGKRSQFELLSLHDSTQKSTGALKKAVAGLVKSKWKGKALPFPVVLDQGGKTVKAYGITGFPTHVLIDPQGRIVEGGSLEALKSKLR